MRMASEIAGINNTWEKVLEYASSPLHGTMSRKIRKGVKLKINNETTFTDAQLFVGDTFVRLTQTESDGVVTNVYYDLDKIVSITTISEVSA